MSAATYNSKAPEFAADVAAVIATYAAGFESHERRERAARLRALQSLASKMIAAGIADEINVPIA